MMTKLVGFGIARNLQQKSKWIKFVSEGLNECFDNLVYKIPPIYSALAIFGGKRQLPPIMPPKIKLSAADEFLCH